MAALRVRGYLCLYESDRYRNAVFLGVNTDIISRMGNGFVLSDDATYEKLVGRFFGSIPVEVIRCMDELGCPGYLLEKVA